jgi:hypothetical protein
LTILAGEHGDKRWPTFATRWHARFVSETPEIGSAESAFARSPGSARWANRFQN